MDNAHIEANRYKLSYHEDSEYTRHITESVFAMINRTWFRPEYYGFDDRDERSNPDAPLIYIGNHSGMAFPWDAMVFGSGMFERNGWSHVGKSVRPLVAPMLTASQLMNPFMLEKFWERVGGLDATFLNFETMMRYSDSNVLIYPEGLDGIGKGFDKKYQLQRFATSFVRMALKYKTDIIPVLAINGEYVNPYMYKFTWISRITRRVGIPYLPIGPIIPLLVIMPWMFYYSMPAKLIFVKGTRIRYQDLTDTPYENLTAEEAESLGTRVREMMQVDMDKAVQEHGQKPFQMREFWQKAWENRRDFPFYAPFGWVLIFAEFERLFKQQRRAEKNGERKPIRLYTGPGSTLLMMLRNPFSFLYFIPVIGLLAMFVRGMKIYRGKR